MSLELKTWMKAAVALMTALLATFNYSAQASPTQYTLDCDPYRKFPSGVPATFTSRANVTIFRLWCNQAGTDTLTVYVDTRFDARTFEQMGLPSVKTNDTDIVRNTMPTVEIERVETSKTTVPGNATTDYPLQVNDGTDVYTFNSYDSTTKEYTYSKKDNAGNISTVANTIDIWLNDCGNTGGSCLWDLEEVTPGVRTTRKKTVTPKSLCPSHKTYYFINSVTGEAVSNFISGGSCFNVTVKTDTVLVYPD